jgi:DNA-binding MarR family transcriptional regulator
LSTVRFVAIVADTIAIKSIRLDAYVLDALLRDLVGHDRSPSAYIVYVFLWRLAAGSRRRSARISHKGIADETGLSKSTVQAAIRHLGKRKLLRSVRETITATPEHFVLRPWVRR